MEFESVRRRGSVWEDALKVDEIIQDYPFHTTGKKERDFENGFSNYFMARKKDFKSEVITQIDKTTTVKSIYCFGKNNRPDLTLSEDGIAFELKFLSYDGFNNAIGQGHIYRLQYKFVFLILIISEDKKDLYYKIAGGEEKNMEDILIHLAATMNIFTYIVPAFDVRQPGVKKCLSYFK